MKIIITGSLGNIGKPLTQELVQKGHQVTVISSKSEKQKDIEVLGAKAAIGSLHDIAFLSATFKDSDAVFCMVPPNYGETDQISYYRTIGNAYQKAIENSSIKRVVHLSSWGAHLDKGTGMIVGSHNVENILNELKNVSLTHLRPGSFYSNMFSFIPMIKYNGIIGSNYGGSDKVVMAHTDDIAKAASEELQQTSLGHKVRYVASDELTCNEAAKVLGTAIGKPELQWLTFTNGQTEEGLAQNGVPSYLIPYIVDLGASIHSGAMGEDYELNKPVLGRVKIEDFAKEFAIAYNQQ